MIVHMIILVSDWSERLYINIEPRSCGPLKFFTTAKRMKFSYSLQYNTVPEWTEDYLHYSDLKRSLHEIETARLEESKGLSPAAGTESNATVLDLGARSEQLEGEFLNAFASDAERVSAAFVTKKEACYSKLRELFAAVVSDSSSDVAVNRIEVWSGDDVDLEKRRATLEDSFNTVYLNLHDLHDFLDLNYTGYVKLVKSYANYVGASAEKKRQLIAKVDSILPIAELSELQSSMGQVEEVYARVMCEGSVPQARAALHLLLRDRVAAFRQSASATPEAAAGIVKTAPILPVAASPVAPAKPAAKAAPYFTKSRIASIAACAALFIGLLAVPASKLNTSSGLGRLFATWERQSCLAILLSCTLLWCFEALPLYVTAMLIPALVAVTRCLAIADDSMHLREVLKVAVEKTLSKSTEASDKLLKITLVQDFIAQMRANEIPRSIESFKAALAYLAEAAKAKDADSASALSKILQNHMSAYAAATYIFNVMFTDMIFLLIGGFSMAAALQKYGITRAIAVFFLQRFGKTPSTVLLTIMTITVIASGFVSNVTAPVLSFSLIQPILHGLNADSMLARGLILGIAFAANIGGLLTPIASPQSVIGADKLGSAINFGSWFIFSLPVAAVSTMFCWFWLRVMYPSKETLNFKEIFAAKAGEKTATAGQMIYVSTVSAITLILWIFNANLKSYTGPMGIVAVFPIVALFGAGMLGKDDFNGFMWHVVFLALGGSALGKALADSQLLDTIGKIISSGLEGANFYTSLAVFVGILLFITTFISHSVGAMVFLPIIQSFAMAQFTGIEKSNCYVQGLVMAACFTCSAGMAMPISGFPNMTAAALQDRNGMNYVNTVEFMKGGVIPSAIVAASIAVTFGLLSTVVFPPVAPV